MEVISYICNAVLVAFVALREFTTWRKTNAEASKASQESEGQRIKNESEELQQYREKAQILDELLKDVEDKSTRIRDLGETLESLGKEKSQLQLLVDGQRNVIEDHKQARKEWLDIIASYSERLANNKQEIAQLKNLQELHTRQISECADRDKKNNETILNLEGRLNILVGIIKDNNLALPEGLTWTHLDTSGAHIIPNGETRQ